jgi:squalene/oxidosqualene cyclase-like protein
MSFVAIGGFASLITLAATKPKNYVSDSRIGIILLCVAGGIGLELCETNDIAVEAFRVCLASWIVLWCLSYWDNSRGELAPCWRALGVGPIGSIDALLFCAQPLLLAFVLAKMLLEVVKDDSLSLYILSPPAFLAARILFGRPASFPGYPRAHKIAREPSWPRRTKKLNVEAGWMFAEAQESHDITESSVNNGYSLTGEPAGRQIWYFKEGMKSNPNAPGGVGPEFSAEENPNTCDKLFRRQMLNRKGIKMPSGSEPSPQDTDKAKAHRAAKLGVYAYCNIQCDDGHWAGDYGGPMFLMPGLIITWYVTGKSEKMISPAAARAMIIYLRNHQQIDGGWGTHIESPSTMFGTTLNFVALRLLGVPRDDEASLAAVKFIREHGGTLYTASWAKLWLCVLGVMEWEAHNPVPPEMWLLPDWTPFHPGRLWCHCRMVYLPMGYLYGSSWVYPEAETDPVIESLREELYPEGMLYEKLPWGRSRHWVADIDNYSPVHPIMSYGQSLIRNTWERFGGGLMRSLRRSGVRYCLEYMQAEDIQTNFVDIGPVNKVMNMLVSFIEGGADCENFQRHLLRVPDYLWVSEDGMKMQGYNGSQCWDTSFTAQAFVDCGVSEEGPLKKIYGFLERTQILSTEVSGNTGAAVYESESMRKKYYRHVSKGGWPFSTSAHGWPISDCTAEALKAMLMIRALPVAQHWDEVPESRFFDAVNVLLTLQNTDGGFATYENNRGYAWFEWLNPSEVFGDIMIDYSYVECTNASIGALAAFAKHFPKHRHHEVTRAVARARQFLLDIQREDGSWYGSWACCFTYASWFGVEGLLQAGEPMHSPNLKRACAFLLKHQNPNGGWGEDFTSCFDKNYAENGMALLGDEGSGVVCTSWALMALMAAECEDSDAVVRGVRFLVSKQLPTGEWPQEGISGVFNRACGITYTAYRNVFPIWALGRFSTEYEPHVMRGVDS